MKQKFLAVLIGLSALGAVDLWPEFHVTALVAADDPIESCLDAWGSVEDPDDVIIPVAIVPSDPDVGIAPVRVSVVQTPALPYHPRRARGPPHTLLS